MVMDGKVASQAIQPVTMFTHCLSRHRLTRPGLKTRLTPYQIRLAPYQKKNWNRPEAYQGTGQGRIRVCA
jgi:hypothetical protein